LSRTRDYITHSAEETEHVGARLGRRLRGGEVILLFGPLGAGKTQLVRGIAAGLGLDPGLVSSPSYALINEYAGRRTLYHVDLYRLSAADLPDLGLEDLYGRGCVVVIEWAERLEEAGWDLGSSIIVEVDHHPDSSDARIIGVDEAVSGA
jgi:tRNA threonylcarbamoyladenosine biosynthesis protein TsaE